MNIVPRLNAIKAECARHRATLIAVSKTRPLEEVRVAHAAGHRDFGENRVDELLDKAHAASEAGLAGLRWHFLGRLQSNKIKKLFRVPHLAAIHSVDRLDLLEKLYVCSSVLARPVDYFLQINTSGEREKAGLPLLQDGREVWEAIADLAKRMGNSPLRLHGLMAMSKLRTPNFEEDARACFEALGEQRRLLRENFDFPDLKLSMGMSSDYLLALATGSDYIRVGRAIFQNNNA